MDVRNDPRLARQNLSPNQWEKVQRLKDINDFLKGELSQVLFDLVVAASELSMDIILEEIQSQ